MERVKSAITFALSNRIVSHCICFFAPFSFLFFVPMLCVTSFLFCFTFFFPLILCFVIIFFLFTFLFLLIYDSPEVNIASHGSSHKRSEGEASNISANDDAAFDDESGAVFQSQRRIHVDHVQVVWVRGVGGITELGKPQSSRRSREKLKS